MSPMIHAIVKAKVDALVKHCFVELLVLPLSMTGNLQSDEEIISNPEGRERTIPQTKDRSSPRSLYNGSDSLFHGCLLMVCTLLLFSYNDMQIGQLKLLSVLRIMRPFRGAQLNNNGSVEKSSVRRHLLPGVCKNNNIDSA